jgi:hypothetical protein
MGVTDKTLIKATGTPVRLERSILAAVKGTAASGAGVVGVAVAVTCSHRRRIEALPVRS